MTGRKLTAALLLLVLCLQVLFESTEGFVFGPMGQLECSSSSSRPGRGRGRRPSCSNCRYTCRCPGNGTSAYYRVAARYRSGRCIPRNRVLLNCDRFRWCATCRTNLPERDYHGCKRLLPGAPRHH